MLFETDHGPRFLSFDHYNFGIVSDFDIRISNFGSDGGDLAQMALIPKVRSRLDHGA